MFCVVIYLPGLSPPFPLLLFCQLMGLMPSQVRFISFASPSSHNWREWPIPSVWLGSIGFLFT